MEASESGGVRDQVQKAIDDLRSAGEKATGDVRSNIDSAVSRLRDISGDATSRAQDQILYVRVNDCDVAPTPAQFPFAHKSLTAGESGRAVIFQPKVWVSVPSVSTSFSNGNSPSII